MALTLAACEAFAPDLPAQSEIQQAETDVVDPSRIIVLVNSVDASSNLTDKALRRGYTLREKHFLSGLDLVMLDFTIPNGLNGAASIRELESLQPGATAGLDHRYGVQPQSAETPTGFAPVSAIQNYANMMIGWPAAGCAAHTRVGMIDGRIDRDLLSNIDAQIITADFTGGAQAEASDHGSAIAALLVGSGRLSQATLYAAAVVDSSRQGGPVASVASIILALDWLRRSEVGVVNVSLAGPYNKLLDRAVTQSVRSGMVLVAAVGNDGAAATPRYPAAFDDVIAVTAIDRDSKVYENAVRGDHVDVAAPGVDVFINDLSGGRFMTGTSIAAPFVTSRIAADPTLSKMTSAASVVGALRTSAIDLGPKGPDDTFGAGLIKINGPICQPH
ncbi:MAG: S8 family serine peptidase [Pseudomonadota bacterium]